MKPRVFYLSNHCVSPYEILYAFVQVVNKSWQPPQENDSRRRQRMIAKYGSTYGPKIAEGDVELGMTRDMVIDAFSTDDILLHAYRVSNSTDWSDNRIETWEYDYDMAKRYMDKEMGDDAVAFNLLMGLGSALGYNLRAEMSKIVKYKYLRFKNGKLIELKDSSFYDDIDNATDNLNNSLWMLNGLF